MAQSHYRILTPLFIGVSLRFNTLKSDHLSFKSSTTTTCKLLDVPVVTHTHVLELFYLSTWLGIITVNTIITNIAYRMLSLLRPTSTKSFSIPVKTTSYVYLSSIRSRFTYGSLIWRPYLIKDIKLIEQIQCRTTKFILIDFRSNYYNHLIKLEVLPIKYMFELLMQCDVLF